MASKTRTSVSLTNEIYGYAQELVDLGLAKSVSESISKMIVYFYENKKDEIEEIKKMRKKHDDFFKKILMVMKNERKAGIFACKRNS